MNYVLYIKIILYWTLKFYFTINNNLPEKYLSFLYNLRSNYLFYFKIRRKVFQVNFTMNPKKCTYCVNTNWIKVFYVQRKLHLAPPWVNRTKKNLLRESFELDVVIWWFGFRKKKCKKKQGRRREMRKIRLKGQSR